MTGSPFAPIALAPPDPILGLTEAFNADPNPNKVNLGVGVYQNENGKVPVLRVVQKAEEIWRAREDSKSYLPIDGVAAYNRQIQTLLLGSDSPMLAEGRAVTVQALGGTGALKIGADFLKRFFPGSGIYISSPSWENHRALFEAAGFQVHSYPYYDERTHSVDFERMVEMLQRLPSHSIVLLHGSCHNPTGVDLNRDQWNALVNLFRSTDLIPFIDFAYQGFGEGLEEDACGVRAFANAGIPCLIANSFSKTFSLYRERVGGLTLLTSHAEESKRVLSQVKRVIRTNYSSPPSHGAQIVALVLSDPQMRVEWEEELREMRERIHAMRSLFVQALKEAGVEQDFGFIARQSGMFSYSGLSVEVVRHLRAEHSLYIVESGRICVAAMNTRNIGSISQAIASALKSRNPVPTA
jgi:aromatic-amino-acid transaminase